MWNQGGYSEPSMGGGYTQSPGGFASPALSQGGEKKGRLRATQIIPCTVSQLMSASQSDEVFRVGDVEISQSGSGGYTINGKIGDLTNVQKTVIDTPYKEDTPQKVTIVGIIRNTEKSMTNIQYKVDDMTGSPMDVKQWVDMEDNSMDNAAVPPGTYVKVSGSLRSFQSHRSVVAFNVRPLEDMNEITSHMLEVVQAHMALSKPQTSMTAGGRMSSVTPMSGSGLGSMGGSYAGANDMVNNGLSANQNQVLSLIRACPEPQGISIQDLKQRLGTMSMAVIKQAVDFLSNEGHIFSTIDEDHFKSTDSDD